MFLQQRYPVISTWYNNEIPGTRYLDSELGKARFLLDLRPSPDYVSYVWCLGGVGVLGSGREGRHCCVWFTKLRSLLSNNNLYHSGASVWYPHSPWPMVGRGHPGYIPGIHFLECILMVKRILMLLLALRSLRTVGRSVVKGLPAAADRWSALGLRFWMCLPAVAG